MAVGALMAYLYFYKLSEIKKIFNFKVTVFLTVIVFIVWILNYSIGFYKDSLFIVLFAFMILGLSVNKPWLVLENKVVNYLGKISYGLYVYHWIMIYFAHNLFYNSNLYNIKLYLFSLFSTIGISIFSYEFIEKRILKFKNKFSVVKT